MDRSLITENDVRDYLLGRVSDEERLEAFEEMLFSDEQFCSLAEAAEESLIDEHLSGQSNQRDRDDFLHTLTNNRDRREKTAIASILRTKAVAKMPVADKVSIFDSVKAMFRQPAFAGGFAVLLITVIAVSYFVFRPKESELADLRAIYNKERPTESRISGFEYAPLVTTRGVAEEREAARLRRIELTLIEATERTPDARSFHLLGVFYLTQQKLGQAIEAFERSLKIDPKSAQTLNDLGSAYFEKAKTATADSRFKTLSTALENFSKAVAIDAKSAAALFNKSLCLQELLLNNEARESWQQYLTLDPTSGWADEARKNLEKLEKNAASSKTKEDALTDMLAAYKNKDETEVWRIASQTREVRTGLWLPNQLTRKFLEAKIRGDDTAANDAIGALKYIGELERSRNADFFVSEMAVFYSQTDKTGQLLIAKNSLDEGFGQLVSKDIGKSRQSFTASRDAFLAAGDKWSSMIADLWLAHSLPDDSEVAKSDAILTQLLSASERGGYKWLGLVTSDWVANNQLLRNEFGKSISLNAKNLKLAEQLSDSSMRIKLSVVLASSYDDIGEIDRAAGFLGRIIDGGAYLRNNARSWQRNFYSASVASKLGMLSVADHFAQEALFNVRNSDLKASQALGDTLRRLIEVNRRKGDLAAALEYAAQSEQFANETTEPAFRAKLMRYTLAQTADLRREMGDHEAAIALYDEVARLRSADAEVQIDAYETERGKLLSLIALNRQSEADEQLKLTLELSESFRSKILDADSRIAFFGTEQSVFEAAIQNALAKNDPRSAFDLTETSRARNLLDFVHGEASVAELQKEFHAVAQPLKLAEIQNSIPPSIQIVEYLVLNEKLAIWYVTDQKFEFVETNVKASDLDSNITAFMDETVNAKATSPSLSSTLYSTLIDPVLPRLDKAKQLVIVADKSLNKLPFAALVSAATNLYLLEDFAISYAPSTNVFVRMTELAANRSKQDERIAIVGNPQFDQGENPGLADLPAAADEAAKIAGLYTSKDLLVGEQAVKGSVLEKLKASPIFHFAGHYVANQLSQPNSRLVLSKFGDDPDLRLSDLAKTKLNMTKFVVLSACETNAERVFSGEGATGVAQTFLAIGSPLVVAGNWKVDSDSTRDVMVAFHENRSKRNMNVAEALRQAQLSSMRSADGSVRPAYFWAAFSAVGGASSY